jgi:hypothetical protein
MPGRRTLTMNFRAFKKWWNSVAPGRHNNFTNGELIKAGAIAGAIVIPVTLLIFKIIERVSF